MSRKPNCFWFDELIESRSSNASEKDYMGPSEIRITALMGFPSTIGFFIATSIYRPLDWETSSLVRAVLLKLRMGKGTSKSLIWDSAPVSLACRTTTAPSSSKPILRNNQNVCYRNKAVCIPYCALIRSCQGRSMCTTRLSPIYMI